MAIQMTFAKHPQIKQHFLASINGFDYIVAKSSFGWHARVNNPGVNQTYEHVDQLVYDNRGQAEYACNMHANMEAAK